MVGFFGLTPSSTYRVECKAVALADEWSQTSSERGSFRTEDDTNNRLSSLDVSFEPVCADHFQPQVSVLANVFPQFEPGHVGGDYAVRIDISNFRQDCDSPVDQSVTARYLVKLSAVAQSDFASLAFEKDNGDVNSTDDRYAVLQVDWPVGMDPTASDDVVLTAIVSPSTGGSTKAARFVVNVKALYSTFLVTMVRVLGASMAEYTDSTTKRPTLKVDGSETLEVTVESEAVAEGLVSVADLYVRLGLFEQETSAGQVSIVSVNGRDRAVFVLTVASPKGLGLDLPIIIARVGQEYPSSFDVSFELPSITAVSVFSSSIGHMASTSESSEVTVRGAYLAPEGTPVEPAAASFIYIVGLANSTCNDAACRRRAIESDQLRNLCKATNVVAGGQSSELRCSLSPAAANPLVVAVMIRRGGGQIVVGALADPGQQSQRISFHPPKAVELSQALHPLSSLQSFEVKGEDFPAEELSHGTLQLWATAVNQQEITVPPASDPNFQPLCTRVSRLNKDTLTCDRLPVWSGETLQITRPHVWVQAGLNFYSVAPLADALTIPQINIAEVNRSDEFEVGPLFVTLRGLHFGTKDNGALAIGFVPDTGDDGAPQTPCTVVDRSEVEIRCSVLGNVLGGRLSDAAYATKGKASGVSPTIPVRIVVRFARELTSASLVPSAEILRGTFSFNVNLFPCEPGHHRGNRSNRTCTPCPIGTFDDESSSNLVCKACPFGHYTEREGTTTCARCDAGYTTNSRGATSQLQCVCARGFFNDTLNSSLGPHGTGICLECPPHAICDGYDVQPYAQAGYWSLNGRSFWDCVPADSCQQGSPGVTNNCAEGRKSDSRRCIECETGYYRSRNECHACQPHDHLLAWGGFFVIGILVFCFVAYRLFYGLTDRPTPKPATSAHVKNERVQSFSAIRLITLCFGRCQLMWALGLMPHDRSPVMLGYHFVLSLAAFDYDMLRPECRGYTTFLGKWFWQWASPFVVLALTALGCLAHKCFNCVICSKSVSIRVLMLDMISTQALFQLTSHFFDDLYFSKCSRCEDDSWCLTDFQLIKCSADDGDYQTMLAFSIFDLCFVTFPLIVLIAVAIVKSWGWQRHPVLTGQGADEPWHVSLSEVWVKNYKGYNEAPRENLYALHDFRERHLDFFSSIMTKHQWLAFLHERGNPTTPEHLDAMLEDVPEDEWGTIVFANITRESRRTRWRSVLQQFQECVASKVAYIDEKDWSAKPTASTKNTATFKDNKNSEELLVLLSSADEIIRETELVSRQARTSFFWSYSWEYVLLLEKLGVVFMATAVTPERTTTAIAVVLLFMLIVLMAFVSWYPHEHQPFNDWESVLSALTFYYIAFLLLEWEHWIVITALFVFPVLVPTTIVLSLCLCPGWKRRRTNFSSSEETSCNPQAVEPCVIGELCVTGVQQDTSMRQDDTSIQDTSICEDATFIQRPSIGEDETLIQRPSIREDETFIQAPSIREDEGFIQGDSTQKDLTDKVEPPREVEWLPLRRGSLPMMDMIGQVSGSIKQSTNRFASFCGFSGERTNARGPNSETE
eukprot:TRINITY_DN18849_c0_g2_i1.p1 TRINITY_DN18849_c0_g2~~TRINITY_DN18849_c0_g2_i1.p1  ORF type:complete len:1762 (-),score=211.94 TRINITY_DN18849_c0_g2_i1:187-4809(-)